MKIQLKYVVSESDTEKVIFLAEGIEIGSVSVIEDSDIESHRIILYLRPVAYSGVRLYHTHQAQIIMAACALIDAEIAGTVPKITEVA